MSLKQNWNITDVSSQIYSLGREIQSPYNDGFTSWHYKQDLYQIKEIVDNILANSPTFGEIETDWLTKQEQKRIISYIKGKQ